MFNGGKCPRCGGALREMRGIFTPAGSFRQRPDGYMIRTSCPSCGKFYGYRRKETKRARSK